MVVFPTPPAITCPTLSYPVAVVAIYKTPVGVLTPFPVSGADVTFKYSPAFYIPTKVTEEKFTTGIYGVVQSCVKTGHSVEAWIQKANVNFGAGIGKPFRIGITDKLRFGLKVLTVEAVTPPPGYVPPPTVIPCAGTLSAEVPDIREILSRSPTLPSGINIPISSTVNGVKQDIPIKILLDNREYPFPATSNRSIDIIRIVQYFGLAELNRGHTVRIESTKPDCNIPPATFSIPPLIPTGPAIPTIPTPCAVWETAASIGMPPILQVPFNIGISNANWICKDTGAKTPINTTAEVYIGGQKFFIPISAGAGSLSLSQADIDKIIGAPAVPVPVPAPLPTPVPTPTECEKTGKIGEPGKYLVSLAEVQAYLNKCHPGGVAELAPPGPWTGAFKITRGAGGRYAAGSYFWATTWQGIRGTY